MIAAHGNFVMGISHIRGIDNNIADSIFGFQMQGFRQLINRVVTNRRVRSISCVRSRDACTAVNFGPLLDNAALHDILAFLQYNCMATSARRTCAAGQ